MRTGETPQNGDIIDIFKCDLQEAERLIACDKAVEASQLLVNAGYSLVRNLEIDISSKKSK